MLCATDMCTILFGSDKPFEVAECYMGGSNDERSTVVDSTAVSFGTVSVYLLPSVVVDVGTETAGDTESPRCEV